MKAIFREIRNDDLDAVAQRLAKDPALVHATAKAPPKKDDGQAPLQVAIKMGNYAIAHLLLDHGADVDFMEVSDVNEWRIPVLHDAVMGAVMRSRYLAKDSWDPARPSWRLARTQQEADDAYGLLARMLELGADVGRVDSSGNSALVRAALDARQVLPTVRYDDPDWVDPKPLNDELVADLDRVFAALRAHGADPEQPFRRAGESLREYYRLEPVGRFLT